MQRTKLQLTVIVLAGGKGERMGGVDKGLTLHHGKPLVSHVLSTMSQLTDDIVISCNRNHESYQKFGYPTVSDDQDSFDGPLAGLMSCRHLVRGQHVLVTPCDTPNLSGNVYTLLAEKVDRHQIAVCSDGDRLQPLIFLAPKQTLETIPDYLAQGRHSVTGWIESLNSVVVNTSQHPEWFWNINTSGQLNIDPEAKKPSN